MFYCQQLMKYVIRLIIYLSKYIIENIIESIKYKYLLMITYKLYVIEINKE